MQLGRVCQFAFRFMVYAISIFGPPAIILAVSATIFWDEVEPDYALAAPKSELPVTLFDNLSGDMLTICGGLAVSTIVAYRFPAGPAKRFGANILLVTGMAAALLSTYSGLRFRYDLAQLTRLSTHALEPALWRLHVQGFLMLAQVSALSALGTRLYFHRGNLRVND